MLKIKLARFGRKHQPHFRIVVNEARDKRDGQYVALLGHYSPATEPKELKIDTQAYNAWLVKGAQPTDTVASLFKRFESGNPFPPKKAKQSKKAKAKAAAAEAEKAKPAAPAAEEPKTEAAAPSEATETPTEQPAAESEAPAA